MHCPGIDVASLEGTLAMRTRFRGATCVLPEAVERVDLIVQGRTIEAIDPPRHAEADHVVDADGLMLLPGLIDDQVHFREPGLTHKEDLATGSQCCAKGGVTTYFEMPNTNPTTTDRPRLMEKRALAASKSVVHYGFYLGATTSNLEALRTTELELTPGIKIFIGSSTGDLLVDDQEALERIFAETSLPICAHCEDESTIRANRDALIAKGKPFEVADHSKIRDHQAALIATRRAIDLAVRHKHRFHVLHVSTADELELIRGKQPLITAEACPHHLWFTVEDYERLGTRIQMNPSVKTPRDREALWEALRDGTLQVVATDHAPHTEEEKRAAYPESPSGMPSVEYLLPFLTEAVACGKLTWRRLVEVGAEGPARVWDVRSKGGLIEGFDADLVLVDPEASTIVAPPYLSKAGWNAWEGTVFRGRVHSTWVHGRCVYRDGIVDIHARGEPAQFDHERDR